MRIGHCQLACTGTFDGNLAKVVKGLERAEADKVDVLSFPECFLTGYWGDEANARKDAFSIDSERMRHVLDTVKDFSPTVILGFNEVRGPDLYNTCMVVERGRLLGTYSKCSAFMPFHKQGRDFPVFQRDGVTFGIIICSDGQYIEPARILTLKGARVIFAPHYNYVHYHDGIYHFMRSRMDHVARAVENSVWFVRGNSVSLGDDPAFAHKGVGPGDSYVLDPHGEIIAKTQRHREDFLLADVDATAPRHPWTADRNAWSLRELARFLPADP